MKHRGTIVRAVCVSLENDRSPCKSQGWRESLMSTAELEKLLDTAEYLFYERGYQAVVWMRFAPPLGCH